MGSKDSKRTGIAAVRFLDKAVRLEKVFLKTIGSRRSAVRQPFEIYRSVLDDIEDNTEPTGRSGRTFPYNQLIISVAAVTAKQRAAMEAVFAEPPSLNARVVERLRERGCQVSADLEIALRIVDGPLPQWKDRDYHVEYRRKTISAKRRAGTSASKPPEVRLTVLKGRADRRIYRISAERVELGRMQEVMDDAQQVVRRNHVAFLDSVDGPNHTVSRQHAHIRYLDATAEFRLLDDNSTHGTRVLRDGRTIEVPRGGTRGAKLRSGDEIVLGQARLRFELS